MFFHVENYVEMVKPKRKNIPICIFFSYKRGISILFDTLTVENVLKC